MIPFNFIKVKTKYVCFFLNNYLFKMILCSTHGICGMDMELFDLTNVINAIKINHLNMTNCDCNVIVNDVTIILFIYLLLLLLLF
jgi:hypothetical protein